MIPKWIFNIAYFVMIIAVVLTCIFIYHYLTSESSHCLANPLEYYKTKVESKGATCYCMKLDAPFK